MNLFVKLLSSAALLSCAVSSELTLAGGREGSGGNARVCRGSSGKITSAQLWDLWEGEQLSGLKIERSDLPFAQQITEKVAKKLHNIFSAGSIALPSDNELSEKYGIAIKTPEWREYSLFDSLGFSSANLRVDKTIMNHINGAVMQLKVMPSEDAGLKDVQDSGTILNTKVCKMEQLANYYSQDHGTIDKEIWDALGQTDKAAFYVHEGVYKYFRDTAGESDSRRARMLVAHLFSDFEFQNIYDGLGDGLDLLFGSVSGRSEGTIVACEGHLQTGNPQSPDDLVNPYPRKTEFFVRTIPTSSKAEFQFKFLDGFPTFSKKTMIVPTYNGSFQDFNAESRSDTGTWTDSNYEGSDHIVFTLKRETRSAPINMYLSYQSGTYPDKKFMMMPIQCR